MKKPKTLQKMKVKLSDPVDYYLVIGDDETHLNPFIGKKVKLEYSGNIYCVATGEKITKTYNNGYSYKAFISLPECDLCIMKPELCHYDQGTCRDSSWGEKHCLQPHYVYLANSSELKVGITRKKNIPTRWIDQGASFALPILEVKDRKTSGIIENELRSIMSDKTNWRKMLKNEISEIDLEAKREEIYDMFDHLIDDFEAIDLDDPITEINYPVLEYPKKIKSLNFEKQSIIEDILIGIKGQYLIFENGVINIRKYAGYEVSFNS